MSTLQYISILGNYYFISHCKLWLSAPFPVGKVNFPDMHPMSCGEFLDAVGKKQLRLFVEDKDLNKARNIYGKVVYARS